jgi:aspartyl-tRNA(Asn)/glutamyl-tRNA(Gln) amidotransferase subunit A
VALTDKDPADLGVAEAARALAGGALTSRTLVTACLERIHAENATLKAFIHVADDLALAEADRSDARRREGGPMSPLDGVPIALKDNIDAIGQPSTNGLGVAWMPNRDAGVVTLLRERGLVLIGKTNMHEGALGATTDNLHHGRADNPAARGHTPGGSSGGSSAAVAARLCPGALGTDTMGSVRLPAGYCGITGFKPSRGHWPNSGVAPLALALDTVGPMARGVADTAMLIDLPYAPTSASRLVVAVIDNIEGAEIEDGAREAYDDALARLRSAGVTFRRARLSDYDPTRARRAGLIISEVEGAVTHEAMMAECPEAFSPDFRAMLDYGATVPAPKYVKALREVDRIGAAFAGILDQVDAIISPTTPQRAFAFDEPVPASQADFTAPANFAGCPGISIPIPRPEGERPMGLHLMAGLGRDVHLLGIAAAVESLLAQ